MFTMPVAMATGTPGASASESSGYPIAIGTPFPTLSGMTPLVLQVVNLPRLDKPSQEGGGLAKPRPFSAADEIV